MARFRQNLVTTQALAGTALVLAFVPTQLLAQSGGAPSASAQPADGAEPEIVVTAQRRAERSLDVPVTVTSVTARQLETAGANQLTDLARVTPALRFDAAASFVQPTIRGVGTAVATSGGGANVGIYVDGFYSPNPAVADFQLMNVDSVQVLKGPQGTLFGRNTTGGAILVTTAQPSTTTSAAFKASYGRFDAIRTQSYVTTGLTDRIAVDFETLYAKGNGFVRNIITGDRRQGAYRNWGVRTGLKANVTDDVTVLLRYSHNSNNDPTMLNGNTYVGDVGVGSVLPAATLATKPGQISVPYTSAKSKTDIFQGTIKADLGFADLTSYTQYRRENTRMIQDLDNSSITIFTLNYGARDRTVSQELLLTSKPGSRLQWTAGGFYFTSKDTWPTNIALPTPLNKYASTPLGGSSTTTQSIAGFVDATYELVEDKLFLTGGARYAHDEVKDAYYILPVFVNPTGARTSVPDYNQNKVTPRAVIRYKPTPDASFYASFTKGYKAGILDVGGNTGNRVRPENITAYEVGAKYSKNGFSAEVSGYYYDYKDLQVSLYVNKNGAPSAALINAAKSKIYGAEGQLRYRFDSHFDVSAGGAYTHARYRRFDNAPVYVKCGTPGITCGAGNSFAVVPTLLSNVTMQRTPEFTGNISGRYTTALAGGKIALSSNLYYSSKFFFGPSGIQFVQKGYEVLALRAEWTDPSGRLTLAGYADNVTGKRYRTSVGYNLFGVSSIWNAPITYGGQIGYKF